MAKCFFFFHSGCSQEHGIRAFGRCVCRNGYAGETCDVLVDKDSKARAAFDTSFFSSFKIRLRKTFPKHKENIRLKRQAPANVFEVDLKNASTVDQVVPNDLDRSNNTNSEGSGAGPDIPKPSTRIPHMPRTDSSFTEITDSAVLPQNGESITPGEEFTSRLLYLDEQSTDSVLLARSTQTYGTSKREVLTAEVQATSIEYPFQSMENEDLVNSTEFSSTLALPATEQTLFTSTFLSKLVNIETSGTSLALLAATKKPSQEEFFSGDLGSTLKETLPISHQPTSVYGTSTTKQMVLLRSTSDQVFTTGTIEEFSEETTTTQLHTLATTKSVESSAMDEFSDNEPTSSQHQVVTTTVQFPFSATMNKMSGDVSTTQTAGLTNGFSSIVDASGDIFTSQQSTTSLNTASLLSTTTELSGDQSTTPQHLASVSTETDFSPVTEVSFLNTTREETAETTKEQTVATELSSSVEEFSTSSAFLSSSPAVDVTSETTSFEQFSSAMLTSIANPSTADPSTFSTTRNRTVPQRSTRSQTASSTTISSAIQATTTANRQNNTPSNAMRTMSVLQTETFAPSTNQSITTTSIPTSTGKTTQSLPNQNTNRIDTTIDNALTTATAKERSSTLQTPADATATMAINTSTMCEPGQIMEPNSLECQPVLTYNVIMIFQREFLPSYSNLEDLTTKGLVANIIQKVSKPITSLRHNVKKFTSQINLAS